MKNNFDAQCDLFIIKILKRIWEEILNVFRNYPITSVREVVRNNNKVWQCFKKNKLKAFKPKFLHTPVEGDELRRFEFYLWSRGNFLNNHTFSEPQCA